VFRYVARRVAWAIPTLLLVTFLVYVALRTGTDPVKSYLRINPRATPAKVEEYIRVNGLDPNYVAGYFRWLFNFITLDWPRTIGLFVGVYAALRPGGRRDVTVNTAAFIGISVPPYVSAVLFQLLFAVYWSRWFGSTLFPTSGVYPPGHTGFNLGLMVKHMVLPTLVVAIQIIAVYSRYMRSSLLDVLNSDYMRTARSKGISERRVLVRHGLRNALIPIVTIAALDVGTIVGGLIITENVFSYPGMGKYFLDAFGEGDFPLLMPWMVIIVASVLFFNLLADVAYAWLDPRIRLE